MDPRKQDPGREGNPGGQHTPGSSMPSGRPPTTPQTPSSSTTSSPSGPFQSPRADIGSPNQAASARSDEASGGVIDSVKETAGAVADKVQEKAGAVAAKVQEKAAPVVDQAQETMGQVADTASEQASSRLDSQRERAAEGLGSVAQAIRQTGQQLREKEQAPIAQYADKAADQVERFSGYLRARDVGQIVNEAEGFARRQPTMFVAGAFGIGLLLARFLKSSGQRMESMVNEASHRYPSTSVGSTRTYSPPSMPTTPPRPFTTSVGQHGPSMSGSPGATRTSSTPSSVPSTTGGAAGTSQPRQTPPPPPSQRVGTHPLPDVVKPSQLETESETPSSGFGPVTPSR